MASAHQMNTEGKREFKVVLLTEVDKLTKDVQHALRRTMEKYIAICRVILVTNSTSKVIPVRVLPPLSQLAARMAEKSNRKETANEIVQEQSPRKLSEVRTRLYMLITHCVPPEVNNLI